MIGLVPPDRWTCPSCGETEVPRARDEAGLLRKIRRAQERHARNHASALAAAAERAAGGAA